MSDSEHDQSNEENETSRFAKRYKEDPSLENYVRLRRENPNVEIEVAIVRGIEPLFAMELELEKNCIDPNLVAAVLDANLEAISEMSLILMERIIEERQLSNTGETQLVSRGRATPDRLIDWLIAVALEALSWNNELVIPRDLIVLIRERLDGATAYHEEISVHERKRNAAFIAGQLKAQGIRPAYNILGEALKVSHTTVMRWFEGKKEFEDMTDFWATKLDKNGKFTGLASIENKKKMGRKRPRSSREEMVKNDPRRRS